MLPRKNISIKQLTKKTIAPDYIVLYQFKGTFRRAGIGHISLWDGMSYYSYGEGNGQPWIEKSFSINHSNEKAVSDHDTCGYGPHKKIILPLNLYLSENFEAIRSNIHVGWKTSDYSLFNKNCSNMVQDYLVQAKLTPSIPSFPLFPLYPSEVANNAKNIGEALVKKIVNEIMSQSVESRYQKQIYKDFLGSLTDMISMYPILNKSEVRTLCEVLQSPITDKEKFCKVFLIIARHHYENTSFGYEINERDKFYENMFVAALDVKAKCPNFENEPQSYKTGKLRQLIAIIRGVTGAIVSALVAIVALVPAMFFGLYKLSGWTKNRSVRRDTLTSIDVELAELSRGPNNGSTKNIRETMKTPLLASTLTPSDEKVIHCEHKSSDFNEVFNPYEFDDEPPAMSEVRRRR